jgi:hypothetical protein
VFFARKRQKRPHMLTNVNIFSRTPAVLILAA